MNFNLSEEQNMLKDSIARFVRDEYDFDSRRANAASDLGFNLANWQVFAELGWLSIPFDEAHGGFGGGQRADSRGRAEPSVYKSGMVRPLHPTSVVTDAPP